MFTTVDDPEVCRIVRSVLSGAAGRSFKGVRALAESLDLGFLSEDERGRLSLDRPVEVVLAVGYAKGWIGADAYGVLVQGYLAQRMTA